MPEWFSPFFLRDIFSTALPLYCATVWLGRRLVVRLVCGLILRSPSTEEGYVLILFLVVTSSNIVRSSRSRSRSRRSHDWTKLNLLPNRGFAIVNSDPVDENSSFSIKKRNQGEHRKLWQPLERGYLPGSSRKTRMPLVIWSNFIGSILTFYSSSA